jgi:gamma-glutamylcyclotransferase (GGCT)/AIG2-like uncharacterized protein YtfP
MTLFLYGTLLPGLARPSLAAAVARLRPLGPATVPGRLYDLGPYPGLVADDGSRATGELFAVPDRWMFAEMDAYEGDAFRRVPAVATRPNGETIGCWLYEYAGDLSGAVIIASGNYRRWVRSSR